MAKSSKAAALAAVPQSQSSVGRRVDDAAALGDHRELLLALREKIAREIAGGDVHPRDLAALSRRLIEISEQIRNMETGEDDIAHAAATPDEAWSAR
jgi:hypothetical protein